MQTPLREGVIAPAKPVENRALRFPRDQECHAPTALERRIGERDARLGFGADGRRDPSLALCEHRAICAGVMLRSLAIVAATVPLLANG